MENKEDLKKFKKKDIKFIFEKNESKIIKNYIYDF